MRSLILCLFSKVIELDSPPDPMTYLTTDSSPTILVPDMGFNFLRLKANQRVVGHSYDTYTTLAPMAMSCQSCHCDCSQKSQQGKITDLLPALVGYRASSSTKRAK